MWLPNEQMALDRVACRVKLGGHNVPDDAVRRRYHRGLKNFFELYQPIADTWRIYEASKHTELNPIAHGEKKVVTRVDNLDLWKQIQGRI